MRSNLDDATRQRILADIGIDVWRLRTGKSPGADAIGSDTGRSTGRPGDRANAGLAEAGGGSAGSVTRARSGPGAATAVMAEAQESRSGDRSHAGGSRSGDRSHAGESRSGDRSHAGESRSIDRSHAAGSRSIDRSGAGDASVAGSVEPFTVRSFAADGVILLLEREPVARERLLVRDLFAAATGRGDCEPVLRRFDWPPAVVLPGADEPGAADRALRAFVAGELADHGCTLLLLNGALAGRLDELRQGGERLSIPDLAVLGRDPAEKRRLWAAILRYRRAAADSPAPAAGGREVPSAGARPEGEAS